MNLYNFFIPSSILLGIGTLLRESSRVFRDSEAKKRMLMPPRAASHTPTQKKPDPLFLASFYWSRKKTQQTFADLGLLGGQFYYLIILWRGEAGF